MKYVKEAISGEAYDIGVADGKKQLRRLRKVWAMLVGTHPGDVASVALETVAWARALAQLATGEDKLWKAVGAEFEKTLRGPRSWPTQ